VLAQRLVRTLCPACRVPAAPSDGEGRLLADLRLPSTQPVWSAPGCDACNRTGFNGRTGVYELLRIDEPLRRMIHDVAGEHALRDAALRSGMRRLRDDGARWIAEGRTSLAELTRVSREG
jgi:general secretion pathway protein E